MLNAMNWYACLNCDDNRLATTFKPRQSYPGYYSDQKRDQPPRVKEQTCSWTPDHGFPQKKNINCCEPVSGPECSSKTTHGRWSLETTRPLERLSEVKFLKNFHQYWLECGGKEVKDPLKKTLQALQQVTMAGNELTHAWIGKLMQHAISIEDPSSTKHKYLWREFELAIHEGREPDWEGAQKPLKTQPDDKQNTWMEISAIKFEPSWKEQL
jgi:hypothetical protein